MAEDKLLTLEQYQVLTRKRGAIDGWIHTQTVSILIICDFKFACVFVYG